MYTRISIRLIALTLFATPVLAQTPPAPTARPLKAAKSQLSKRVDDRLQFMRKMYALDKAQLAKARGEMTALADEHATYMDGQAMMVRRLSTAIVLVLPNQSDLTDAQRETIRKKLQRDLHRIHAEAPLSYASVAKLVEKSLGKDQIAVGRKQMASSFARQLAGAMVDIDKLDALVIPPLRSTQRVAVPPTRAANPWPKPPTQRTAKPHDHASHAGRPHEPQAKLPPPPKGKLSALRAPQPVVAAPPVEQWPETLSARVKKYGFSAPQSQSAQSVLASCRTRAEAHLVARKTEYAQANQLTDAKAKAVQIKKLNTRIDQLYHEMNQRIDSIASIEQRLASQRSASKKAPAEKKPAAKPPAKKVVEKKAATKADPSKPGT